MYPKHCPLCSGLSNLCQFLEWAKPGSEFDDLKASSFAIQNPCHNSLMCAPVMID